MLKQLCWQRILIELIIVIVPSFFIGLWCNHIVITLLFGLILFLVWQIFNQIKLANWLWQYNRFYPPHTLGSWDVIFYGLHKRQRRYRQRQNELAELIKRFRTAAESLPDSLIIISDQGHINWCNKLAQYQLNIHWPEDKGQNIINLIRYPDFSDFMRRQDFSMPFTMLFNQRNYLEFRVIPYTNGQQIILVRDVDQLYLAEKLRQDFFTNASHELRTPITVVKGYLDMLCDDMVKPENKEKIYQTMQKQIDRTEALISQILMLSHIENSSINRDLQFIDMPTILQQIETDVRELNPDYQFDFDVDPQLYIEGNKQQLYSAVSNLIFNAIKHTPTGSKISVVWQKQKHGAYFSVQDNGPGILPQHLHRLTERFYRTDEARSNHIQGSGLGLAIVKHALINHSNTKLEIKSQSGHGSQFSFTLPVQYITEKK